MEIILMVDVDDEEQEKFMDALQAFCETRVGVGKYNFSYK